MCKYACFLCMNMAHNSTTQHSIDEVWAGFELITTSPTEVCSWSAVGISTLFHSESGSISAAKRLLSPRDSLAVCDRQGILLYNIDDRTTNSYRLKGRKGRVRSMHYDELSQRLFFTTQLQDAVQCFSTDDQRLLRSAAIHPSPPLTFSFSASLDAIISTSISPPMILLTSMTGDARYTTLRTDRSALGVAETTFQTGEGGHLALIFFDGTLVIFDVRRHDQSQHDMGDLSKFSFREIGHVKKLHSISSVSAGNLQDDSRSGSSSKSDPKKTGKFSLAFNRTGTKLVTAGPDGKCCIVSISFNKTTGMYACVNIVWRVGAPSVSLSITSFTEGGNSRQARRDTELFKSHTVIAVGRVDGCVSLFDVDGRALAHMQFEHTLPIIGLEWIPLKVANHPFNGVFDEWEDFLTKFNSQILEPSRIAGSESHTPLKDLPHTDHKAKPSMSPRTKLTGLRRPGIPIRTKSRPRQAKISIPRPPSHLTRRLKDRDANVPASSIRPLPEMIQPPDVQHGAISYDHRSPAETAVSSQNGFLRHPDGKPFSSTATGSLGKRELKEEIAMRCKKNHTVSNFIQSHGDRQDSRPIANNKLLGTYVPHTRRSSKRFGRVWDSENQRTTGEQPGGTPESQVRRRGLDLHRDFHLLPYHLSKRSGQVFADGAGETKHSDPCFNTNTTSSPYSHDLSPCEHPSSSKFPPSASLKNPIEPARRPSNQPKVSTIQAEIESVRALVLAEMVLLRDELGGQFQSQRNWFENITKEKQMRDRSFGSRERIMQLEVWRKRNKGTNSGGEAGSKNVKGKKKTKH